MAKKPTDISFDLHPKQSEVFQTTAREVLYGGAAGGGKSFLMRVYAIFCCMEVPNVQVYLFRRSYKDLARNHLSGPYGFRAMLQPLVEAGRCKVNASDMQILWDNGAIIHLCHLQREDSVYDMQGAEINVLLIDEATLIEEFAIRFLRSRVRQPDGFIPEHMARYVPKVLYSANPGGVSHTYFKSGFVDAAKWNSVFTAPEDDGGYTRIYIPAKLSDNPSLNAEDYSRNLKGLGSPDLVKAMLEGSWDLALGSFFAHVWNREVHMIPPFPIPKDTKVKRCYDWGASKPFSCIYIAELREPLDLGDTFMAKGTMIVIGEIYGGVQGKPNVGLNLTNAEMAERIIEYEMLPEFQELLNGNQVQPGESDSSIFARVAGYCMYDEFKKRGAYLKRADKGPGSIGIGLQLIGQRLQVATDPERRMEEPALYFFNTLWNLPRIIETVERDESNPEIVKNRASVNDHALDALRYGVNSKSGDMNVNTFSF